MLEKSLITVLSKSDISKGEILIPGKAIYLEKKTRLQISGNSPKTDTAIYKYIFILNKGQRVGGILFCGTSDLHIIIFKKYRNKGFMSEVMKSGWIKKLCPELKSITTQHFPNSDEYKKIEHLAMLAELQIRN